jgi:hypothetical protein
MTGKAIRTEHRDRHSLIPLPQYWWLGFALRPSTLVWHPYLLRVLDDVGSASVDVSPKLSTSPSAIFRSFSNGLQRVRAIFKIGWILEGCPSVE